MQLATGSVEDAFVAQGRRSVRTGGRCRQRVGRRLRGEGVTAMVEIASQR